jgi:hypothetical protein
MENWLRLRQPGRHPRGLIGQGWRNASCAGEGGELGVDGSHGPQPSGL